MTHTMTDSYTQQTAHGSYEVRPARDLITCLDRDHQEIDWISISAQGDIETAIKRAEQTIKQSNIGRSISAQDDIETAIKRAEQTIKQSNIGR